MNSFLCIALCRIHIQNIHKVRGGPSWSPVDRIQPNYNRYMIHHDLNSEVGQDMIRFHWSILSLPNHLRCFSTAHPPDSVAFECLRGACPATFCEALEFPLEKGKHMLGSGDETLLTEEFFDQQSIICPRWEEKKNWLGAVSAMGGSGCPKW